MTTLLIDNYDSFTWNVYQFLCELGADVRVFRNDGITVEEAVALNPRNIVISPGPGHPRDAGVSNAILKHFTGKVPILGVCLGEQCMVEAFGGIVTNAGELVHGKTTPVSHDGRGLFEGVPQDIPCTRYHSLAADPSRMPDVLQITSQTASGVIMGVRHSQFVVEGVQFHPESIASEYGRRLFANFLSWQGGCWTSLVRRWDLVTLVTDGRLAQPEITRTVEGVSLDTIAALSDSKNESSSILKSICAKRRIDLDEAMHLPGKSFLHLQRSLALGLAPVLIDFKQRLLCDHVAVLAEVKRASPSKGSIDVYAHAATQAKTYAMGGAAAISILTEPKWFKGSLDDLLQARLAIDGLPNRPAVLRKEFIIDRYQVLEARLYGADSLLLIVACLTDDRLADLLKFSRQLGMEPLVEVASTEEMQRALNAGSQIIGVNNRDLNTFKVDTTRTTSLATMVPSSVVLLALSGITCRADIEPYLQAGARGVLVGEALMKASDKQAFITSLSSRFNESEAATTSLQPDSSSLHKQHAFVKVCGITNEQDAMAAVDAGADFLGFIFASKSPRFIPTDNAKQIIASVHKYTRFELHAKNEAPFDCSPTISTKEWTCKQLNSLPIGRRPLTVGVFTDSPVFEIQRVVKECGLDLVQLHSTNYDSDLPALFSVPVIQVLHVSPTENDASRLQALVRNFDKKASLILLDTIVDKTVGGSGVISDWSVAKALTQSGLPLVLAGGLNPSNVQEALAQSGAWCVDVCSGVEESKGKKDIHKLSQFIKIAKHIK